MQAQCDIHIVRTMPPQVFWPRPKVTSAMIHIVPNLEKRAAIADVGYFHSFVRSLFLHRRKFLRGVLIGMVKDRLEKSTVDELLAGFAFSPDVRAEQLDVQTLLALAGAVRQAASMAGPLG
jgi:16S rRNA (adenine1518-N6/adenine1519-N6)-dimethyltransferase